MEQVKHFDTDGACFLCLAEPSKKMTTMSFRSVCRYLKINTGKGFTREKNDEETEFAIPSDITCCERCSSLTTNLSSLINQVEIMTMLITHEMKTLDQILSECENKKPESGRNFQQNMKETCNPVEIWRIEQLRAETRKKCRSKVDYLMSTALPKVLLTKIQDPVPTATQLSSHQAVISGDSLEKLESSDNANMTQLPNDTTTSLKIKDEDNCNAIVMSPKLEQEVTEDNFPPTISAVIPIFAESNSTNLSAHNCFLNTSDLDKTLPSSGHTTQEFVKEICKNYSVRLSEFRFQCLVCEKSIYFSKIRRHVVCIHPEVFFAEARLPTVSLDGFRLHCRTLLATELHDTKTTPVASDTKIRDKIVCAYCPLLCLDSQDFRFHLMNDHYDILHEKLQKLQETPEPTLEPLKKRRRTGNMAPSPSNKLVSPVINQLSNFDAARRGVPQQEYFAHENIGINSQNSNQFRIEPDSGPETNVAHTGNSHYPAYPPMSFRHASSATPTFLPHHPFYPPGPRDSAIYDPAYQPFNPLPGTSIAPLSNTMFGYNAQSSLGYGDRRGGYPDFEGYSGMTGSETAVVDSRHNSQEGFGVKCESVLPDF